MKYLVKDKKVLIFVPISEKGKIEEIKLEEGIENPLKGLIRKDVEKVHSESMSLVEKGFMKLFEEEQKEWKYLKSEHFGYKFTPKSEKFWGFKEETEKFKKVTK